MCKFKRAGTVIVGSVEFVEVVWLLVFTIPILIGTEYEPRSKNGFDLEMLRIVLIISRIVLMTSLMISGTTVLVGAFKEDKNWLIPFLIIKIVAIVLGVIAIGWMIESFKDENFGWIHVVIYPGQPNMLTNVLNVVFSIITWIIVYSYFNELKNNEMTSVLPMFWFLTSDCKMVFFHK